MKLKNIFKSFGAVAILMATACSPDDYGFGSAQYTSDQLVAPDAYTVTVEGNRVHLVSNLKDCTPLWITPSGRSQNADYYLDMPFAGDYEVTFGAETRAGAVYGEPYKFTIAQNDFSMLSDEKWEFLAGGVGKTKKWYPITKDYGVGQTVGPVTYCDPNNVRNDESNSTDLAFRAWTPNWDPGIQSWLIPADDPYMTSYMEFGLSATDGCTATVFRNDANGGTLMNGKFVLNLDDKTHPVISFNDCYALHSANMDDACANYTQEIKIVELTLIASSWQQCVPTPRVRGGLYGALSLKKLLLPTVPAYQRTTRDCLNQPTLNFRLSLTLPQICSQRRFPVQAWRHAP